ncbi:MAG: TMEM165/GDT1 family protein [Planctomycetota bacterium]
MDWKLFLSAFTTILVAELGDKTQLATLALASSKGGRLRCSPAPRSRCRHQRARGPRRRRGWPAGARGLRAQARRPFVQVLLGAYYLFAKNGG